MPPGTTYRSPVYQNPLKTPRGHGHIELILSFFFSNMTQREKNGHFGKKDFCLYEAHCFPLLLISWFLTYGLEVEIYVALFTMMREFINASGITCNVITSLILFTVLPATKILRSWFYLKSRLPSLFWSGLILLNFWSELLIVMSSCLLIQFRYVSEGEENPNTYSLEWFTSLLPRKKQLVLLSVLLNKVPACCLMLLCTQPQTVVLRAFKVLYCSFFFSYGFTSILPFCFFKAAFLNSQKL